MSSWSFYQLLIRRFFWHQLHFSYFCKNLDVKYLFYSKIKWFFFGLNHLWKFLIFEWISWGPADSIKNQLKPVTFATIQLFKFKSDFWWKNILSTVLAKNYLYSSFTWIAFFLQKSSVFAINQLWYRNFRHLSSSKKFCFRSILPQIPHNIICFKGVNFEHINAFHTRWKSNTPDWVHERQTTDNEGNIINEK